MRKLTVALRRYPHTAPLLDGDLPVEGADLEFANVDPIHEAFAPMVRELRYDASEMALATLLQAREAGVRIAALPLVLLGSFPHRALYTFADGQALRPEDLPGRRVGIRAYSQTTGLWLRGVLSDTYGVNPGEVTWVTTEGPHVATAADPSNVERTQDSLVDQLRTGAVSSVVLGAPFAAKVDGLVPVIDDWEAQQEKFLADRGWVPVNHLLVVRQDLLESEPALVRGLYRRFAQGIDAARPSEPSGTVRELVVRHGIDDILLDTVATAIRYALEQGLIHREIDPIELFSDAQRWLP